MPGERLSMRKIRELLRLRWEQHLPQRVIANSLGLSQGSVSDYLSRARRVDLTWPLPDGLDDAQLEALLFPPLPDVPTDQRPVPDWSAVHRDLRRPNVTLARLCCMDPFLVASDRVATQIGKPISLPGSSRPCRSNTMLNTVTTFPSPGIGSRTSTQNR